MRLSRPTATDDLVPGSSIQIVFMVDGQEIRLPGQAKWLVSNAGGATNIGVSLWLELAEASARQAWARWIVAETERRAESASRPGAGQHSVVRVSSRSLKRAATSS